MDRRAPLTLEALLLIAVLGLFSLVAFAGDERVMISGHLFAGDRSLDDAIVVVELGDNACLRSELSTDGRFAFELPRGVNARLVFLKPGFAPKAVLVDTRNAMVTERARKANKHVRFDVVLDELAPRTVLAHVDPAGRIAFVNGTGLMRVWHEQRREPEVVPVEEQAPAVPQ